MDEHEMVMDFKLLKEKMYSFLDAFDHSLLISDQDSFLCEVASKLNPRYIIVPYSPTAEMMASHIYLYGRSIGLDVVKVIVHETDSGCAICESTDGFEVELKEVIFSDELIQAMGE